MDSFDRYCISSIDLTYSDGSPSLSNHITYDKFRKEDGSYQEIPPYRQPYSWEDILKILTTPKPNNVNPKTFKKTFLVYQDNESNCRIIESKSEFVGRGETQENCIGRFHSIEMPEVCEFYAVSEDMVPSDELFRDAWRKGTLDEPITIDLDKAIEMHRIRLKEAAHKKIVQLQPQLAEAIRLHNLPLQVSIKRTQEILSSVHEMNLTHCKNIEDLKKAVPKELHDVWEFYKL